MGSYVGDQSKLIESKFELTSCMHGSRLNSVQWQNWRWTPRARRNPVRNGRVFVLSIVLGNRRLACRFRVHPSEPAVTFSGYRAEEVA